MISQIFIKQRAFLFTIGIFISDFVVAQKKDLGRLDDSQSHIFASGVPVGRQV